MDKLKKVIVLMIVIIVVLIIILSSILLINGNNFNNKANKIEEISSLTDIINEEEENVRFISLAKTVENCIQKYYDTINIESSNYYAINANKEYVKIYDDEYINSQILSLLSKAYIDNNNINLKNIRQKVKVLDKKAIVVSLDMKDIITKNNQKYLVHGIIMDFNYKLLDNFYMYVTLDSKNNTFSVEPINEKVDDFESLKIEKKEDISIESNNLNIYEDINLGYEETIREYINRYKRMVLSDIKLGYLSLNKEYRNKKFENIDDYKKFVKKNYDKIKSANLTKYLVNNYEDYTELVGIDQYGFYYIFRQRTALDYEVLLDTYTINLKEFDKKYNIANDQIKVGMNIEKVIEALNGEDYRYVYTKLDETFKNDNYETIEKFENFCKKKFPEKIEVEYKEFQEKGNGIYVYEMEQNNSDKRKLNIVMKLLEDSNFVISFSVE